MRNDLLFATTWLCFVICAAPTAMAVDIEETIWGFDGRVVPYRFNPVSLLVSNTTEDPVGIKLQLRRSMSVGGDRVGARVEEAVFLSPFSSRWVQFYPYVASEHDEWSVSWGFRPSQQKDLTQPKIGGPARVALVDTDQLARRDGKVKSFPEELFPPFVSATETLEAVYLDHVPRWQDQRRQALLDWVQTGGTLFVTPDDSGEYPVFTGQLAIFNSPLPDLAVGHGQVVRAENRASAVVMTNERLGEPFTPSPSVNDWNLSEGIFQTLKSISSPKHNWWVINVLSVMYIGLVFPGWYLLSRRPTHHRTTILAFIGVAILFTVVFNLVGRRGYGESTTVNTLAIARHIDGDAYDVQTWTNVFVTGGDQYELSFDGEGDLYSTGTISEKVAGLIDNGLDGQFIADIPLFSSRAFMHRGKAVGPKWDVTVQGFPADETRKPAIEDLELQISPPPRGDVSMYVVHRNRLHSLYAEEGYYRATKRWQLINDALVPENFGNIYSYYNYGYDRPKESSSAIYSRLTFPSISRSLSTGLRRNSPSQFKLDDDRIRLLIYDELPASFSVKHPKLQASQGRVLYSIDIRLPEALAVSEDDESDEADPVAGDAISDDGELSEVDPPADELDTENTEESLSDDE